MKTALLLACLLCGTAAAQSQTKAVDMALGNSGQLTINYDSRFANHPKFGFRVGLGLGAEFTHNSYDSDYEIEGLGIAMPLSVYHLVGKERHFLELGVGATPGLFWEKVDYYCCPTPDGPCDCGGTEWENAHLGVSFQCNVGYRLETKRTIFRAGFSPAYHVPSLKRNDGGFTPFPYLSIGYRF